MHLDNGVKVKILSIEVNQFGDKYYWLESLDNDSRVYPKGYRWTVLASSSSFWQKRKLSGYQYILENRVKIDESKYETKKVFWEIKNYPFNIGGYYT